MHQSGALKLPENDDLVPVLNVLQSQSYKNIQITLKSAHENVCKSLLPNYCLSQACEAITAITID